MADYHTCNREEKFLLQAGCELKVSARTSNLDEILQMIQWRKKRSMAQIK